MGVAPRGDYRLIVKLYSACNLPRTRYVVTVPRNGLPTEVFAGEFNTPSPAVDTIGTFTH